MSSLFKKRSSSSSQCFGAWVGLGGAQARLGSFEQSFALCYFHLYCALCDLIHLFPCVILFEDFVQGLRTIFYALAMEPGWAAYFKKMLHRLRSVFGPGWGWAARKRALDHFNNLLPCVISTYIVPCVI